MHTHRALRLLHHSHPRGGLRRAGDADSQLLITVADHGPRRPDGNGLRVRRREADGSAGLRLHRSQTHSPTLTNNTKTAAAATTEPATADEYFDKYEAGNYYRHSGPRL